MSDNTVEDEVNSLIAVILEELSYWQMESEMPDNAEKLELAEIDVTRLIAVMHKALNYSEILKIFLRASLQLKMLEEAEYYRNKTQ